MFLSAVVDRLRQQKHLWVCRHWLMRKAAPRDQIFSSIFRTNLWGSSESASGRGSTLFQTASLRERLPRLVRELGIRRILDIACGDWNWMSQLDLPLERYIGADIVPAVIERNSQRYSDARHSFMILDAVADWLPPADLIMTRDTLVHLCLTDALRAIDNFRRSGARYLLATHFPQVRRNYDIRTGNWRPLNLDAAPFHFGTPMEIIDEGIPASIPIVGPKTMGLWRIDT